MKSSTLTNILMLLEKKGSMRPRELQELLDLSPQIIHRHLKKLVQQGLLEIKGSAPFTQYALAGVPNLESVSNWINARVLTGNPESLVCETRDVFAARLPILKSFVKHGLPEKTLPLVIIAAGEIGNNSFDHNLGQWRDVPGCWFESQITGRRLWISIADRGQGVYQSLHRTHPELADDQVALKAAFETVISGRSPEKRGNGLKFAREIISKMPGDGLACVSGNGRVQYGGQGENCLSLLNKHFPQIKGTVTLMTWRLP